MNNLEICFLSHHTKAMISTNDIGTKTIPTHTWVCYLNYSITYGKKSAISSPTLAVNFYSPPFL